jgi:hypothetical protein
LDLERAAAGPQQPQHRGVVVQHVAVEHIQPLPPGLTQDVPAKPPEAYVLMVVDEQLCAPAAYAVEAAYGRDGRAVGGISYRGRCDAPHLVDSC